MKCHTEFVGPGTYKQHGVPNCYGQSIGVYCGCFCHLLERVAWGWVDGLTLTVSIGTGLYGIFVYIVQCPELTDPLNGIISCSLGDDGALSYEDTCSFTCNAGYELTGSDTRTCQSDGNWSGTNDVCRRGNVYNYFIMIDNHCV